MIIVTWDDNSDNESAFFVERGTDGVNFSPVATTSAGVTSFSDGDLPVGVYYYRVYASNPGGSSGYSNVASASVAVPADPSGLNGYSRQYGTTTWVVIGWADNANNESYYDLERSTDGVNFAPRISLPANSTSYYDFGVTSGNTYYCRVKARNNAGSSGYSNVGSVTIP